jgi:nucleoside-diphosphate-sugar epimerase
MNFAITGHTQGIGLALANKLCQEGHSVLGFSRTNGFDLNDPATIKKIAEFGADADCFINNAHCRYAQAELVFEMAQKWKDQKKTIVCISSRLSVTKTIDHPEFGYQTTKTALDDAISRVRDLQEWPRISLVRPPTVTTQRSAWIKPKLHNRFYTADEFAEFLTPMLLSDQFFLQEVWFTGQIIV